jgi:hypothetical protein
MYRGSVWQYLRFCMIWLRWTACFQFIAINRITSTCFENLFTHHQEPLCRRQLVYFFAYYVARLLAGLEWNWYYSNPSSNQPIYSGPSGYDRPDIRTTWVTIKILVLTYDQSLELRPEFRSRPKRVSACAAVNKDPKCVRKRQSEPRYACLWT